MSQVDELLSAYLAERRREGRADPVPYLAAVEGRDRAELAALIDHVLATAPRPAFDPAAFERFRARPDVVEMSSRILEAGSQTLLDLRRLAGISKQALAERLARDLGVDGDVAETKARYHDLEIGAVDPVRIRPEVWESLAAAFGRTAARVRGAATAIVPARIEGTFARTDPGASPGTPDVRKADRTAAQRRVDDAFFDHG
jgi:hypothetical protein